MSGKEEREGEPEGKLHQKAPKLLLQLPLAASSE
jgi:hypothetical protein